MRLTCFAVSYNTIVSLKYCYGMILLNTPPKSFCRRNWTSASRISQPVFGFDGRTTQQARHLPAVDKLTSWRHYSTLATKSIPRCRLIHRSTLPIANRIHSRVVLVLRRSICQYRLSLENSCEHSFQNIPESTHHQPRLGHHYLTWQAFQLLQENDLLLVSRGTQGQR